MRFLSLFLLASTVLAAPLAQEDSEGAVAKGSKGSKGKESKGSAAKGKGSAPKEDSSPKGKGGKGSSSSSSGGRVTGTKVQLIFARGSTELGTMGAIVGPAFSSALGLKFGVGNFKSEGVVYPADIAGAVSGAINPKGATGAIKMADMAKRAMNNGYKVVLSGYSQGAEMVHGALMNLGAEGAKIGAAVTFGDPLKSLPVWGSLPASRTKIFCNSGDGVCGMAFVISAAHMSYGTDASKAAEFVAQAIRSMSG